MLLIGIVFFLIHSLILKIKNKQAMAVCIIPIGSRWKRFELELIQMNWLNPVL